LVRNLNEILYYDEKLEMDRNVLSILVSENIFKITIIFIKTLTFNVLDFYKIMNFDN